MTEDWPVASTLWPIEGAIVTMKKAPHMAGLLTTIVCPREEAFANKAQG